MDTWDELSKKIQRKYRLLVEKLFLKFPQNVKKTILKYTKNSPSFLALDVLNSVLRRLQKFSADFPRNFGQSQRVSRFFFQKKSSKVSLGHVEPTKDNSRETLLPNFEKCFRSTSAGEGLFCCFFHEKFFSMEVFFCTRWIHYWKTCWQESSHVHDCFCSTSESITITFRLPEEKFLISNCSSRHVRRSCEKPSVKTLAIKQKILAQIPGNVQKNDFIKIKIFFLQFIIRTPAVLFWKVRETFLPYLRKNSVGGWKLSSNYSFSENSSKVSPGYVESIIDISFEDILQKPKSFRWVFADD